MVTRACSACGALAGDDASFCEECGARLDSAPPPVPPLPAPAAAAAPAPQAGAESGTSSRDRQLELPVSDQSAGLAAEAAPARRACVACGGEVAADGYCVMCGRPADSERDHWAQSASPTVGGVCDRGIRHDRNEDAMALAAGDGYAALVVCDGVSSAPDSDVASLAAARAALDVLVGGAPGGSAPVEGVGSQRTGAWSALLAMAARAGDRAIVEAVGDVTGRADPPSCTFVAAVVEGPHIVVGWLGDSRAYWLPDEGAAQQLSADDSGAAELMAEGVSRVQAENSPHAHAITRWLGPDAPDVTARTTAATARGAGWLLVCSDGLWNYCSPAADLARLLRETAERVSDEPTALAGALVDWANAQGGRDNITVALARVTAVAGVTVGDPGASLVGSEPA